MRKIFNNFHLSWDNFLDYLPALLGGIICFMATICIANFVAKLTNKYALKRSKDGLISNFISKIAWTVIFILGMVLVLGILGLGTISDKILAGAGITTFVVGFALKDIGENFLSGLILAFSRPYRVGNLIECQDVKGVVKDMTMRQTTVEAENGRVIMIPNSFILKNPLVKFINDDNNLRQEFFINVNNQQTKEVIQIINDTISSFDFVLKSKGQSVKVIIDSFSGDKVKLLIIFWFDSQKFNGSRSGSRSQIILAVMNALEKAGHKYSG